MLLRLRLHERLAGHVNSVIAAVLFWWRRVRLMEAYCPDRMSPTIALIASI
jgi:hypothetical protein